MSTSRKPREAVSAHLSSLPVEAWATTVAPLVRMWLASGDMDFSTGRALDGDLRRLSRAREIEQKADADDLAAEEQAVLAQRRLLAEVDQDPLEAAGDAVLRKNVRASLRVWRDPYAEDAAGEEVLGAVVAMLRAAGGSVRLLPLVEEMLDAGLRRDEAAHKRRRAIQARVAVQNEVMRAFQVWWTDAPDAVVTEVAATLLGLTAPSIEDDWFADPFEP